MVDSVSSSAAANANILAQIAKIRTETNNTIAEVAKQREELENNANLQGPSGTVEEFQKANAKSSSDLKFFGTDVGILVQNTSRLNVISTLAEGDNTDYYKFRVAGRGDAYLGRVGDEGVRVQLEDRLGNLVADSNKDAGDKYENYQSLQKGTFELSSGEYHLRVTRDEDVASDSNLNFALQLRMGDYKQDYDTIVKQPEPGDDPFQPSASVTELTSMLNQQASFLSTYQFGQSGTEKLMGSLFSGVF